MFTYMFSHLPRTHVLQTTWHIISWGLPVCNPLPENLLRQKSLMNYLGNLLASFWVSKHWWKQFRHLTEPHHTINSMLSSWLSIRMRRFLRFLCISLHSIKTLSFPFSSIYSILFPTGYFRQKRRWYKTQISLSQCLDSWTTRQLSAPCHLRLALLHVRGHIASS